MKKKYIIFSILLAVILTTAFSIFYYQKKHTLYSHPKRGDVTEAIYGLGTVKSNKVFEVKIGVMSTIKNLYVEEGEKVKEGQKIIEFDGMALFRAPFSGTVTNVEFKEGEIALPQVVIVRIEDLDDKYVEVSLEQDAALRVRKGQHATVIFESLTGEELHGEVKRIYPKDGDFLTYIEVKNLKANILTGMSADVVINVGSKKDVLLIPIRAISNGFVLRRRDGNKEKVKVKIGHSDGAWVELIEGDISLSDELVIKVK